MEESRRQLPPELHYEIHKCLPLPNAIDMLVNISSWEFVNVNLQRTRQTIQRVKLVKMTKIAVINTNF
jgi:hypothetical protein